MPAGLSPTRSRRRQERWSITAVQDLAGRRENGAAHCQQIRANFTSRLRRFAAICVAFPRPDSTVLLACSSARDPAVRVRRCCEAWRSPNASLWRICERFCANHGVALAVEEVRVDPRSPLGLEAAARMARYAVYSGRSETYIALGHHMDDQAETVLLQLLRGTGMKGIAAMPEMRELKGTGKQIFRPMLDISRAALLAYAQERELRWVDDESNASPEQDRNFVRLQIAPLLDGRFAGWREALARLRATRQRGRAPRSLGDSRWRAAAAGTRAAALRRVAAGASCQCATRIPRA